MPLFAQVRTHELKIGTTFDGALPDGTSSAETIQRGRQIQYADCDHGGLFVADDLIGFMVFRVMYVGVGSTIVNISAVDQDGVEYQLHKELANPTSFMKEFTGGLLLAPGWKLKVVSTTALTAKGRCSIQGGAGWGNVTFGQLVS